MTENSLAIVDPRKVVIDDNIRKDINDAALAELTESIKTLGVLQLPTVTVATDGKYHLVIGQRRILASIAAGLKGISVHVVDEHTAAGARLIDQIAENEHRSGLTEVDLLRGFKQLALLGYSVDEIETRTRKPRARIEAAIAIADNDAAVALVAEKQIDLVHAATIAEFEGDKKAVKALTEVASTRPAGFEYKVRELQKEKSRAESKKALAAQLKADGVTVIKDSELGYNGKAKELTDLTTDKGANLTLSNHKKCPGHSAAIKLGWNDDEAKIAYCCTDWAANGHQKKHRGYVESEEDRAKRLEREKAAAELQQAVEISRELRLEFTTALLLRNKPATLKGADLLIAHASTGEVGELLRHQLYIHAVAIHAVTLLSGPVFDDRDLALEHLTESLTDGRYAPSQATLATAIAGFELFARKNYSSDIARLAKKLYFTTLANWGHNLTDLEQEILDQIAEIEADIAAQREADALRDAEEAAAAAAEEQVVDAAAGPDDVDDPTDVDENPADAAKADD